MDSDSDSSDDSISVENAVRDFSEEDSDSVSSEDNSESESSDDAEEEFRRDLEGIKNNDPHITELDGRGHNIQNITNERWEEIGRDISNNTHLERLALRAGSLNDDKISFLFRGLTRSSSIEQLWLYNNNFSVAGVRSMVPFLQNATNLWMLNLNHNNIQSEGFNIICRALRDSPIERLHCINCTITSFEIDNDYFPRKLTQLYLSCNNINADGCRGIAQSLQGGDSKLEHLDLNLNEIDDEAVANLVEALRNNASLKYLGLQQNDGITKEGLVMLLKLVNDISSINATLQSHHTLRHIYLHDFKQKLKTEEAEIKKYINMAIKINTEYEINPEAAGIEKVIRTQLASGVREAMAGLQGVSQSVYGEINPLHLPEVLSLVGRRHGQGELYVVLKTSIAGLMSTVNRRQCIVLRLADLAAESEKLNAELAKIDAAARGTMYVDEEIPGNKRSRKW